MVPRHCLDKLDKHQATKNYKVYTTSLETTLTILLLDHVFKPLFGWHVILLTIFFESLMSLWHIMETKFTFIVVALQPAVTVVAF